MYNINNPLLSIHPHFIYVDSSKNYIDPSNIHHNEDTIVINYS